MKYTRYEVQYRRDDDDYEELIRDKTVPWDQVWKGGWQLVGRYRTLESARAIMRQNRDLFSAGATEYRVRKVTIQETYETVPEEGRVTVTPNSYFSLQFSANREYTVPGPVRDMLAALGKLSS